MLNHTSRLLMVLLVATSLGACRGAVEVTRTSDASEQGEAPELDWKPVVQAFLNGLRADWNLVSATDAAHTGAFILDVREPEEYETGFIEGAVNIPLRTLASSLASLPGRETETVVVDSTGHRSAIGMAALQMLGYQAARSLEGGIDAWRAAGLPVVTSPAPAPQPGATPDVDEHLRAALDYYLGYELPGDWGAMSPTALSEDQNRKSSAELEAQPETFDQGRSLLVDVDDPEAFGRTALERSINLPLRGLAQGLDDMPLEETVQWA